MTFRHGKHDVKIGGPQTMQDRKDYTIAAVDRALLVLEALAEQPRQGVTALARRLGLTKTIVFRLLATLEARGFVVREGESAVWSLGHRIGVLGERAGQQNMLLAAARPVMERLREETAENVNLIVREGQQSLVLATLAGRHAIRIFALAGRYGPLHAGGGSMVMLAHAPHSVRNAVVSGPLERFTADTITEPAALLSRIEAIRAQDWNIAVNDLDEGAFSVAAPIRDSHREVIAAISVAGAVVRLDDDRRARYLALVRDAAAEISAKLGIGSA
ncbi:MAG: IclR family transcriptional regulator [Gemmobacter sp.]